MITNNGIMVHASCITRRGWEPRISVFTTQEALRQDLVEYYNEMSDEDIEPISADEYLSQIIARIEYDFGETVHLDSTWLDLGIDQ